MTFQKENSMQLQLNKNLPARFVNGALYFLGD